MKEDIEEAEKPDYNSFFVVGGALGLVGFVEGTLKAFLPTFPTLMAYTIGCVVALVALAAVFISSYIKAKGNRFTLHAKDTGGSLLRNDVRKADESILSTHFTAETPDQKYLDLLRHCLDREVHITRLLYLHPNAPAANYEWLGRFTDGCKHPHCYEQIELTCWLPFNIVIFDNRVVWLFFPGNERDYFRNAVRFSNRDIADKFSKAFFSLKNSQAKGATAASPSKDL